MSENASGQKESSSSPKKGASYTESSAMNSTTETRFLKMFRSPLADPATYCSRCTSNMVTLTASYILRFFAFSSLALSTLATYCFARGSSRQSASLLKVILFMPVPQSSTSIRLVNMVCTEHLLTSRWDSGLW